MRANHRCLKTRDAITDRLQPRNRRVTHWLIGPGVRHPTPQQVIQFRLFSGTFGGAVLETLDQSNEQRLRQVLVIDRCDPIVDVSLRSVIAPRAPIPNDTIDSVLENDKVARQLLGRNVRVGEVDLFSGHQLTIARGKMERRQHGSHRRVIGRTSVAATGVPRWACYFHARQATTPPRSYEPDFHR